MSSAISGWPRRVSPAADGNFLRVDPVVTRRIGLTLVVLGPADAQLERAHAGQVFVELVAIRSAEFEAQTRGFLCHAVEHREALLAASRVPTRIRFSS